MTPNSNRLGSSFRDPSGFLFRRKGKLLRQVNQAYRADYDHLIDSGLYEQLVKARLLAEHKESSQKAELPEIAYKVIEPEELAYISYPYEWSFSQLKDAALATVAIQKKALGHGMSLKDASAYNVQFRLRDGKPVLIDTLSFEIYKEGAPWTAYRQFCQHFLAPLALMALADVRLGQLLRNYIDGVPLDLASKLLPGRTKLNAGLLTHIHLHAGMQQRYADKTVDKDEVRRRMSLTSLRGLIDTLETTVRRLEWKAGGTEWGGYYEDTNYSEKAMQHKKTLVSAFLDKANPKMVWDLGANTGVFSRLASERGAPTVSFDIDPAAVELNYLKVKQDKETNLLPLVQDLTNPSPDIGWANQERMSFGRRGNVDAIMALALVHHLAIANNVPLGMLAEFFAGLGKWLIIEFVPKSDSQVERLLATREDIFPDYDFEGFEKAFGEHFKITAQEPIEDSKRRLYLMERR
jgi:ribosomal protein L11 methylase PrmA